ncbi:MAG: single-stranded-DNA-specific exonuclease RecJ [Gemmatimonadota bacterium]|nr:single-stranded-DNA-specific exonuclease RecJ [Gemmatimonadota bacterium]
MISASLPPLERRWVGVPAPERSTVEQLRRDLSLPEPLCRLLAQRGHGSPDAARAFLRPHSAQIEAPAQLAGVADATARLRRALNERETVLVHGDYDVDGICGAALLVRALGMMGIRAVPFVPRRLQDGYDLTDAGIGAARTAGAALILTVDCGIVAHAAIARARAAGIDVVVSDHHTPSDTLPETNAVVNPHRPDCTYPNKGLCGTGVAWKLCCALAAELGFPEDRLHALLDLVAVATVADLMPLLGENRTLVRWGLRVLARTPNAGLRALLSATGLDDRPELGASEVGYVLAPRLNAVGRLGDAMQGVRLLLTDDPSEAARIAALLEAENRRRQTVDRATLREALDALERGYDPARDRGVVLAAEGWHPGVIGIVASRVVERIHRPVVLIALDGGGEARGSARSIAGFHLHDALLGCAEHLVRFGGHRYAAGCSILPGRVEPFRAAFNARAHRDTGEDAPVPEIRIDAELRLAEADGELVRMLRHLGPFGPGNPAPVFAARGVRVGSGARVVGGGHLKLGLTSDSGALDAIGFGMGSRLGGELHEGAVMDAAFRLEENHWGGRTSVQAKLIDVRPA